ncbi:hypothetical protein TTRE_0000504801 [Trichuris trichiura]|uniref:Cystatin domain-containing protein n=1 Tax=Trichuris trichiura TaxID=36087 RepID=A0A077Z976_TRITR|nr:hypothetical protein TTRE_0000504801 [Trichuris trichiura]
MVALLKLSVIVLCFVSVSAVEKALLDKFAQAAVNGINKDKDSGDKLFIVYKYSSVEESDKAVIFDLIAVQTSCPKNAQYDEKKCKPTGKSPVLEHKVVASKKPGGVFSVASTGPMDPDSHETLSKLK